MEPEIRDVWFRSSLSLIKIAWRLGLADISDDYENYWAWVIGTLDDVQLDITRTHRRPPGKVDTRIFVLDGHFTEPLLTELVGRLRAFVRGPIRCGEWVYRSGNDFDLVVAREYWPTDKTDTAGDV